MFRRRAPRWTAADGTALHLRQARPSDAPQVKASLEKLSPQARRNRFFAPMPVFSDALVKRLTEVDPAREYFLLVMRRERGLEIPVGGGRFALATDHLGGLPTRCEFALVVGDAWQGQGIGRRILQALTAEAARRGLSEMLGHILADNRPMIELARRLGFRIEANEDPAIVNAVLALRPARWWRRLF